MRGVSSPWTHDHNVTEKGDTRGPRRGRKRPRSPDPAHGPKPGRGGNLGPGAGHVTWGPVTKAVSRPLPPAPAPPAAPLLIQTLWVGLGLGGPTPGGFLCPSLGNTAPRCCLLTGCPWDKCPPWVRQDSRAKGHWPGPVGRSEEPPTWNMGFSQSSETHEPFTPVCPVTLGGTHGKARSPVDLTLLPRQPGPGELQGSGKAMLGTPRPSTQSPGSGRPRRGVSHAPAALRGVEDKHLSSLFSKRVVRAPSLGATISTRWIVFQIDCLRIVRRGASPMSAEGTGYDIISAGTWGGWSHGPWRGRGGQRAAGSSAAGRDSERGSPTATLCGVGERAAGCGGPSP